MYLAVIGFGWICFVYMLILFAKGVDFAIIWLPISGLLLGTGGYWRYVARHPQGFRLPTPLIAVFGVILVLGLAIFLTVEGLILKEMFTEPQKDLDVIIVLGAQVRGQLPSRALLRRLEAAEQYLNENPKTVAVLSGGKGDGEDITEAECMQQYLLEHGIDAKRLLLEDQSTSTLENLIFSAKVLAEQSEDSGDGMSQKTGILSNNFHIYRARLLARKCGYTDVYGLAAPSDWRLQIHYLVREFFALVREKMTGSI